MAENKTLCAGLGTDIQSGAFLMEHEGADLLRKYELPIARSTIAKSKEQACQIATEIGYPIVLKGMSREIIHKSDAGVVKVNLKNEDELTSAYDEIVKNALKNNPGADIAGVLVQEFVPKGMELIFGIKKDPTFGHQLVIGLGGIFVEIIKDFSMRMMPVSVDDVEEMLKELKSYQMIEGYRGKKGINKQLIYTICLSLNDLIEEHPEIEELDLNPVIFTDNDAYICDVRILITKHKEKELVRKDLSHLKQMINPQSIAVIGASTNEKKNGGRLFKYVVENGYKGKLFPINPGAKEVKGYKAYPSLLEVPDEVELACIIVAAKHVPDVMEECVAKGVKAAIIYSSGFAETGEEGKKLQEQILAIAKKGNILVLGPNSIGIASPNNNIYTAFGAALETKVKVPGNIGFVSQSGAMGSALLSRAWEQGAGFSRWISVANEADLTTSDFMEVLIEDELTKVITVFMEGIKNPKAFSLASARALKAKKPVLVYKTGRSSIGKRAVQSHTGSIAGDDAVYSFVFKKFGVLRINRIDEIIDVSRAFTVQPLPKGKRIGVITASGGACSIIADLCSEKGLEIPELVDTSEEIKKYIPPFGSAQNPVDVTAEVIAVPEMFKKVVENVMKDPNIDGIIVMLTTNADPGAFIIAQSLIEIFKENDKPLVIGRLGADNIAPQAMELYNKEKLPVYPTPERVVSVMDYLVKYSEILKEKGIT
ncbi:acetate--CoA ligase family protein [Neobacillus sp. OS1-32]|uniref:acetate--CoA ligase family protein n=1 Tax=Neobacillus sp. OS1-32 TaxID=3070682 RepID=UPI0027E1A939|nr:acetate--CoA ligase family protein [Neobacillus sp. OS1-32]WML30145.1 acetate--CoA ligase family protein [Neobacillus sp. OS1-32]